MTSRRSQVVRSEVTAGNPAARREVGGFAWNAMLTSNTGNSVASNSSVILNAEAPRHTSLGITVDFDESDYPRVKIRIPRDGIYSVSTSVECIASAEVELGRPRVYVETDGPYGSEIGFDYRPIVGVYWSEDFRASVSVSHAGFPFAAGSLVWANFFNDTTYDDLHATLNHLSVTYEAPLGTVYYKGGQ